MFSFFKLSMNIVLNSRLIRLSIAILLIYYIFFMKLSKPSNKREKDGLISDKAYKEILVNEGESEEQSHRGADYFPNNKCLNNATWSDEKPVRTFFYHALHKTGSTATRVHLREKCDRDKIACLSYQLCGTQTATLLCFKNIDRHIDMGVMTPHRIEACCSAIKSNTKLEAVIDHFTMFNNSDTANFFQTYFPPLEKMFRFTIVRHPVQQFISYYDYGRKNAYYRLPKDFNTMVDQMYNYTIGLGDAVNNKEIKRIYNLFVNRQIVELTGFDGSTRDLSRCLKEMDSINYIGLYEKLALVWRDLKQLLNWSNSDIFSDVVGNSDSHFNLKEPRVSPDRLLSPKTKQMIEIIQGADMKMYDKAVKIWNKCHR